MLLHPSEGSCLCQQGITPASADELQSKAAVRILHLHLWVWGQA